jgi:hypothetical protein
MDLSWAFARGPGRSAARVRAHGAMPGVALHGAAASRALHERRRAEQGLRGAAEQRERAGEAVQVGRAANGADLAVGEEAPERHVAELLSEEIGVVVRAAVQVLAAPET